MSAVVRPRRRSKAGGATIIQWLLMVYFFLLPFEHILVRYFENRTVFKPYRLVGLVIIVAWPFLMPRRRTRLDFFDKGILFLVGLGLAMAAFWKVVDDAGYLSWAFNDVLLTLFSFFVYLAFKSTFDPRRTTQPVLTAYIAGIVCGVLLHPFAPGAGEATRLSAFFKNPNSLSAAAGASFLLLLAAVLFGKKRRSIVQIRRAATMLLLLVVVVLTGSRSGALALTLGTFILLMMPTIAGRRLGTSQMRKRVTLTVGALMIAASALVMTTQGVEDSAGVLKRYERSGSVTTGSGRSDIWRAVWNVAVDHYLLGVGTAQYRYYHRTYIRRLGHLDDPRMKDHDVGAHNEYLSMLVSTGLLGLAVYLWLFLKLFSRVRKRLALEPFVSPVMAAAIPIMVLFMVAGVGGTLFKSPHYFLFLGVISSVARLRAARAPSAGSASGAGHLRPSRATGSLAS